MSSQSRLVHPGTSQRHCARFRSFFRSTGAIIRLARPWVGPGRMSTTSASQDASATTVSETSSAAPRGARSVLRCPPSSPETDQTTPAGAWITVRLTLVLTRLEVVPLVDGGYGSPKQGSCAADWAFVK